MTALLDKLGKIVVPIYNSLPKSVQDEITLAVTVAAGILNIVQVVVIPAPAWLHIAAAVVSVLVGAIGVRASVTPVSKS